MKTLTHEDLNRLEQASRMLHVFKDLAQFERLSSDPTVTLSREALGGFVEEVVGKIDGVIDSAQSST